MASCLGRNDYNVLFSILTLLILDNFYNRAPKVTSKIIIQIFFILSIPDILWIIYFSGAWRHLSKEERAKINVGDSEDIVTFWDSLWFIHGLVYFLAFIELILKGLLLYYLKYFCLINYSKSFLKLSNELFSNSFLSSNISLLMFPI